jgi:hypothetical protein
MSRADKRERFIILLKVQLAAAEACRSLDDAKLFFSEDRPHALTAPVLEFWDELTLT